MELFLIKHVPISVEKNCDDNQILISTSNHFYCNFLGGPEKKLGMSVMFTPGKKEGKRRMKDPIPHSMYICDSKTFDRRDRFPLVRTFE